MNEPLQKTFTKEQLIEKAKTYLREGWTDPTGVIPQRCMDDYHRDLGLVYAFICELFEEAI